MLSCFIFGCTSLHWRLNFFHFLIDIIEYSMLLYLTFWACKNLFIGFCLQIMVDLLKIIHDSADRYHYLRLIPCKMIL